MPPSTPNQRSVRFADDERGGWSSDRPRRGGGPERPADVSVRGRVLSPTDRLRYSPGSLVVIVSASAAAREAFAARVFEERGAVLSLAKVRSLLAGRVAEADVEARAAELLDTAVARRLDNGESVAVVADGLHWEERDHYVRMAAPLRRPRHLILVEAGRDEVSEEDRAALNEIRNALDAGEMGNEGFQTALRLGGGSVAELKRIVFRPPPRDD